MPAFGNTECRWKFVLTAVSTVAIAIVLPACQSDKATREEVDKAVRVPGKGVAVYAAGDIADCRRSPAEQNDAAKTAALVAVGLAAEKNAAVLTLGDHTYPVGQLSEFTECYGPTWGKFKARTYPAPGNHEYYSPLAAGYYDYFGAAAGPERRGYYSFRLGNWHVISLNSYLKPEEHRKQLDWLKSDLERNGTPCMLAFWHHPLYSSGGHSSSTRMQDVWKMLYDANADLVLTSHDHNYERFAPQDANGQRDDWRGMRQFVVGTGGAKLGPFRFREANSEASNNATHGVLKLVLKETGYEWEFLPVEEGGFTDRGGALCH